MAIYHLNVQVISRGQGRSAVACAAYRSAEKLYDERYGKTHDYTKKLHVVHSEILVPVNSPDWMGNRERLWNEVEKSEKRKDAQLSREVQLSLPKELTDEQNIALAREFVKTEFVSKGMVADLNVHLEKTKPLYLRAPESLWEDIHDIMALTGLSMNAICLELLRPAIKRKLKELKEY